jgi:hypothetical protein
MNSHATHKILQSRFKKCAFYFPLGGGSIDVGLLGENHHKINFIAGEDLLLFEYVVHLLWITSYTTVFNNY